MTSAQTDLHQSTRPPCDTVAVILTTYNDPEFLADALRSVFAQQRPADEVLVVDDGSAISPAPIVAAFPGATLLQKTNGGLASARNAGLAKIHATTVCFLDADDRLKPNALSAGLDCLAASPTAAMAYGGHTRITGEGAQIGDTIYRPLHDDPYADLLGGNAIGMHATVLYRTDVLRAVGGFDEGLRRCEDYDLYLRLAKDHPIATHPGIVAEYRWHTTNMSKDTDAMLKAALFVHDRHRDQNGARAVAWAAGRRFWINWYTRSQKESWDGASAGSAPRRTLLRLLRKVRKRAKTWLRNGRLHRAFARVRGTWPPPLGSVRFGNLGTTHPVSRDFGWDRGTPIDRYYIERFLQQNAALIAGRVLEIGDDSYSVRFGGANVTTQDVLHRNYGGDKTTLVGDLTQPGVLPESAFDCIVLTQTLHLIFDLPLAAERLCAALRPGGTLLLTVPGISQVDRQEWKEDWYWSLTPTAVRRLFSPHFDAAAATIEAHGNVFAATAYLQGLALEEVDRAKLDVHDEAYPVVVTLRARKR